MATANEFEDGSKIEELTAHAEQIQEQLLAHILKKNAATEYLSRYLNGKTDTKLFKMNVPLVSYEDIKPYIDRIADGDESNILSAESVVEFYPSSGTSGEKPKLIPVTDETRNLRMLYLIVLTSVLNKHFGNIDQTGKRLEFMFSKQEIDTPSGLKARFVTTSLYKDQGIRNIFSKRYTSPIEAILCSDPNQSMYCQLLAGLLLRDEVVLVASNFATAILRAIRFLEDYWKELCSDIRSGQLSDWITDSGCRNALSSIMEPNPRLADSIQNICGCKSWDGIIKKLWPKAKFIGAVTTGVMSQYVERLEFYGGGLSLVSGCYACSEAFCGVNLEPLSEPSNVAYTFVPNMAYFEFLPVNKDTLTTSEQNIEPVDLVHVKLGQCYELLVTTVSGLYRYKVGDVLKVTGFHNATPRFQFLERQPKEGKDGQHQLDPRIMEECCYRMEESLNYIYRNFRKQNCIAALEMRVVKQASFDVLMDYYVSRGASMSQYKTPTCLNSREAIEILDSRVVGKFFSPKTPI
ncbi:hypothetical protein GQ457_13G000750 [Hibiscus cannabinus]